MEVTKTTAKTDLELTLRSYLKPEFQAKLDKLNKKIAKFGMAPIGYTTTREYEGWVTDAWDNSYQVPFIDIKVEAPAIIQNGRDIKYLGTISKKEGQKFIFSATDRPLFNTVERCDHCGVTRPRNIHHVFDEAGKELVIGSACCHEYFGLDVIKAIQILTSFMSDCDEDFGGLSYGKYGTPSFYFYSFGKHVTKNWAGYLSQSKAMEQGGTSSIALVNNLINDLSSPVHSARDAQYKKEVLEILKKTPREEFDTFTAHMTKTYKDMEVKTDMDYNLKNAVFTVDGEVKHEVNNATGLFLYAIYKAYHTEAPKEPKKPNTSVHLGTVGEKLEVTAKMINIKAIDSMYGTTYLVMFEDEAGNQIKTFTTGETADNDMIGQTVKIKGTVKSHDVFRDVKATLLTRVKFSK